MAYAPFNPRHAALIGKAGEFSVASQLFMRGMNVFLPAVDNGVDLMAENGCRIQVKTARLSCSPYAVKHNLDGVYKISFPRMQHQYFTSRKAIDGKMRYHK